jgi:hypothetical protein
LTIRAKVFFRKTDRTEGFHQEKAVLAVIEQYLIDGSPGNHEIISVPERKRAILGFQHSRSFMHEDQLVCVCILIKIGFHGILG